MEYATVAQARNIDGLKLVLTAGVPGPWSEAAKAVMRQRGVHYTPVAQAGGEENTELVAWTGHRNAPIALYNNEPPRVRWNEIVELGERLGRGPSLLPLDINERMLAVGLTNEIAGESGFAWFGRQLMLKPGHDAKGDAILASPMYRNYYSVTDADQAVDRVRSILAMLSAQITAQRQRGSQYLVGDSLSIADIYWAYFSQILDAYPPEKNPVPGYLRKSWGVVGQSLGSFDPILIEQRDQTFDRHLALPFTF